MFTITRKLLKLLILGQPHARPTKELKPAISNQVLNIRRIWGNEHYNDFGIERLIRLFLVLSQFVFPGLFVRHFAGKYGLIGRKIGIEAYVVFKLLLPLALLVFHLDNHLLYAVLAAYMALETLLYLGCLIFLSNEFAEPISYRRSLTTLFINYVEVCLNFGVIYTVCNQLIPTFFKEQLTSNLQAVYFSFVTSATLGYGDIVPSHPLAQIIVIVQTILFFVFVAMFLNFFASKIQSPTYYNTKPHYNHVQHKERNKRLASSPRKKRDLAK